MAVGIGGEKLWLSPTVANNASVFSDQSGNGNNGTAVGSISTTADSGSGGSYAFNIDSGSKGVSLPIGIINGQTAYAYGIWVKLAGGQLSSSNVFGGYVSNSADANPTFFVSGTDWLRVLGKSDSGSTVAYTIASPATASVWTHLLFNYSAANGLRTYENGVLQNTYTAQLVTGRGTVDFAIGKTSSYSATICVADDARVYHRELSQAEITHLATSRGILGPPGGLPTNYDPFRNDRFDNKTFSGLRF